MADVFSLYRQMLRSRVFEQAVSQLWHDGLISGEMHLGTGEEAIAAGTVCQLQDGDALALDHRGTPELLMRGVDPQALLREFLGREDGLCRGRGGHMHLFSPQHLAATSGIVGAAGPAAVGFALSASRLRHGTVALAFFGEGAMNQGMLMESLNLAVAWRLPVLFVCKDNGWAITTRSDAVTGGRLADRASSFGMPAVDVDGRAVELVWDAASEALERARGGGGPTFLHATCVHLEGHFLGDPLLRTLRHPAKEMPQTLGPMLRSAAKRPGAGLNMRRSGLSSASAILWQARGQLSTRDDPLAWARRGLADRRVELRALEAEVKKEIREIVEAALASSDTAEQDA